LIGKLIVFGVIAATVIVIAPGLLKGSSHVSPIDTIKQGIDEAKQIRTNTTGSIVYGGILANSDAGNTSKQDSTGAGQTVGTGQIPPQDVIKQTYTGQVFDNTNGTCQVSVPGMVQTINGHSELAHVIKVPNCNLQVNKPVQVTSVTPKQNSTNSPDRGTVIQVIPYANSYNDGNTNPPTGSPTGSPTSSQPSSNNQTSDPQAPPYFQTVQLNAVNQGTSVLLSYDDTTGQTTQVTVTMKNSEKVLFSGTFYSSQFHTEVNDIPNTPHIIEMTIQNAIYGTLHASIYAPPNIQNSTISGVFAN